MKIIDRTIYVSGPISNGGKCTPEETIENVRAGEEIYGQLMTKGYSVFLPHLSYYPDKDWRERGIKKYTFDHNIWLDVDRQWVTKCKYFYYMLPDIYGESKGASLEFSWANALGKRIFTSMDEVPSRIAVTL